MKLPQLKVYLETNLWDFLDTLYMQVSTWWTYITKISYSIFVCQILSRTPFSLNIHFFISTYICLINLKPVYYV